MTGDSAPINRANWNVWAAAHGQDAYYDSLGLVGGADSLTDVERAGVLRGAWPLPLVGSLSRSTTEEKAGQRRVDW
jgi:hypothetical protein